MKAYRFIGNSEEIIYDAEEFLFENGSDYLLTAESDAPEGCHYLVRAIISDGFRVVMIPYSSWDKFHENWVELIPVTEVRNGPFM